jgi:predicted amidohydrolase YtcJ
MVFSSCYKGIDVDLVIHNAKIHTMNDKNLIVEAIAVKDGKIVEVGPNQQILNKYNSEKIIDAQGKDLYPGLTDAHGHILSYMNQLLSKFLLPFLVFDDMTLGFFNNSADIF